MHPVRAAAPVATAPATIARIVAGSASSIVTGRRIAPHSPRSPSHHLHRALNIEPDRLAEVFCLRDKRYVTKDLTLKYDRKRIRLEVNDLTRGLVGKYVDAYEIPDGRIQVRAKGVALPYSILDPHQQRVTHAAITEDKHLSAVLAHIKEEQEKATPPAEVKPVSAKNGYKKTGRRPHG